MFKIGDKYKSTTDSRIYTVLFILRDTICVLKTGSGQEWGIDANPLNRVYRFAKWLLTNREFVKKL